MAAGKGGDSEKWMAFATFNAPETGESWHVTFRDGCVETDVDRAFEILRHASGVAANLGFDGIVEASEMGGTQWKSGMPASLLAQERERRERAAEKAAEKQPAQRRQPAKKAEAAKAETKPAQQPAAGGGFAHGWDISKSPIEVSKIVVQGTKDKPHLVLYSPNPKLQHPVWSNVAPVVIMNCFERGYDLSGKISVAGQEVSLKDYIATTLNDVGRTIEDLQWFIHWVPSQTNSKWKDIVSIEVTKWADRARDGGVPA